MIPGAALETSFGKNGERACRGLIFYIVIKSNPLR
jgi:hypothetical protein